GCLIEGLKEVVEFFLNPLLYWAILLVAIASYRRMKQERLQFGYKVFDMYSEWSHTFWFSIGFGVFITLITVGIGIVLQIEAIMPLSIVVVLFSWRFSMLSASYTIGITYVILVFAPYVLGSRPWLPQVNREGVAILFCLFLIAA